MLSTQVQLLSSYDDTAGICIHPNAASISLKPALTSSTTPSTPATQTSTLTAPTCITARLVVDCMGHFSPIVRQQRWGRKPDGVCLVVGTLASGFTDNTTADVIATTTPIQADDAPVNR